MLTSLHIKDFAIIDELVVDFGPGLNVMTGETGAGKTIVVLALKLVLGERAAADVIRAGKDRATVTAAFEIAGAGEGLRRALSDAAIEAADELVVHRVVSEGGRGRIAVNGVPVTGAALRGIAQQLVDVSSQHEHQLLLDPARHAGIIDAFGGHGGLAVSFGKAHARWTMLARELEGLRSREREAKERAEFLQFQLRELAAANLKPGEEEEIEAERRRVKHAVALEERTRGAEAALYGGAGSAVELIDRAAQLLAQCVPFEADAPRWGEALSRARAEVEDIARELARYAEGLESNPARLEELDERLHLVRGLARKHGGSVASCLARQAELAQEVDAVLRYDDILQEKAEQLAAAALDRRRAAEALRGVRAVAGKKFGAAVVAELAGLGMGKVTFSVAVEGRPEEAWDESGPDRIEYMFSPNVGEPLRALASIASGGELSRVMLAIKGALAGCGGFTPTSVFDEVDSGIGGAIAEVVGKKLCQVAQGRQVICITHLPQVAAQGERHLRIAKHVEGRRTVATVERLSSEARVEEIARMLGGTTITETALAHAKEMLEQTRR